MNLRLSSLLAGCLFFSACLSAASLKGTVVDPSGAPIAGAQVSVVDRVGVVAANRLGVQRSVRSEASGPCARRLAGWWLPRRDSPPQKSAWMAPPSPLTVKLALAPVVDSVRVVGSAIDVAASQQGGSISIIPSAEIRQSNQPMAVDLMRYIPGLAFSQTGATGGVAGLSIRGGYNDFNLVQIDGVPVNAFGGNFDFAHIADRVAGSRGGDSRAAIVAVRPLCQQRRGQLRDAPAGRAFESGRGGRRRQQLRTPLRHLGRRAVAGIRRGRFRLANRRQRPCHQQRLPQPEPDAQPDAALRPPVAQPAWRFRFQLGGRARPVGLRSVRILHRHRHHQPQQKQFRRLPGALPGRYFRTVCARSCSARFF